MTTTYGERPGVATHCMHCWRKFDHAHQHYGCEGGSDPGIVRAPRCTNCLWDSADGIGADGLCDDCRDMQEDEANYSRREWEHDRYDDERREDAQDGAK